MTSYSPDDYSKYRIEKALETIAEVESHIQNKYWNTAVNRMYYTCFYAVSALLIKNGFKASSHSGVRQKFGQEFIKTGIINKQLAKHYADLFEKRQKGDYNDFFEYDEEIVLRLYPNSVELIKTISNLLNIK
jgi:uncharacterized protein (UPF0332 family)